MPPHSHLPPPLRQLYDGRLLGAKCVGRHELFDSELDNEGETAEQRSARHTAAIQVCETCPVQAACAIAAAEAGSHAHGIWAGRNLTPLNRQGRPRKDSAA
ncbi:WhiB family transcriptional regulator [Rhodococcus pyridinivorans]|uniref:WhiB family transcriptional regulator n=1 Tax=Rhodococcus pyridinivorans TaxID=103816 RepID=UPI00110EC4C5|nr:WhiB family transcriptional regulator [Rhodococcus pyridinivorans]